MTLNTTPNNKQELLQTLSYLEPIKKNKNQILVDISGIKRYNSKTGIPRVVLNQLKALQELKQAVYTVEAIFLSEYPSTQPLHFYEKDKRPISLQKGDVIYNPDLDPQSIDSATKNNLYTCYKNIGVYIVTLIHDILPITDPEYFVKGQDKIHTEWFLNISKMSNLLITTSNATKNTIKSFTKEHPPIETIPLGTKELFFKPNNKPNKDNLNFLVVSTIEPRKGYEQLLDAFEILWDKGFDGSLTIVGKVGWNVEQIVERIKNYTEKYNLFNYKSFVEDEELQHLYSSASALILPSFAEGFGLPIIEAAHYNLPIIARDIDVFHEIAQENAFYFENKKEPNVIVNAVKEWSILYEKNEYPKSNNITFYSWEENVKELLVKITQTFATSK